MAHNTDPTQNQKINPNDPSSNIGEDATAMFDNSPSNPTEHASSEALNSATDDTAAGASQDAPAPFPQPPSASDVSAKILRDR